MHVAFYVYANCSHSQIAMVIADALVSIWHNVIYKYHGDVDRSAHIRSILT